MIERPGYRYTKFAELKRPNETVNVWGVISLIAFTQHEVKMMLVDESEVHIFCVLNMDRSANVGPASLANTMILRVHRCKVLRAKNNQITIIGRIMPLIFSCRFTVVNISDCGGVHVAAWCVDDAENATRFRSSEGFTFDHQSDAKRLHELRTFWKRRTADDGLIRKLFFEMVNFRQLSFSVRDKSPPNDSAPLIADDHRQSLENTKKTSGIVFDQPLPRTINGEEPATDNGTDQSDCFTAHVKSELLPPDETFLGALRETIGEIARKSHNNYKCISFSRVMHCNFYFNIICQVVTVHAPFDGLENTSPIYLSVCDGTKANIDGTLHYPRGTHSIQSQLFTEEVHSTQLKDFIYVIGCWDDFGTKAKNLEAGDFVQILNAKIGARDSNGLVHISLHGHTPNSKRLYKRDIECVRKKIDMHKNAAGKGTEADDDEPTCKRTRQREYNSVWEVEIEKQ